MKLQVRRNIFSLFCSLQHAGACLYWLVRSHCAISSQFSVHWCQVGSLKSAMMVIFTPQKLTNAIYHWTVSRHPVSALNIHQHTNVQLVGWAKLDKLFYLLSHNCILYEVGMIIYSIAYIVTFYEDHVKVVWNYME